MHTINQASRSSSSICKHNLIMDRAIVDVYETIIDGTITDGAHMDGEITVEGRIEVG